MCQSVKKCFNGIQHKYCVYSGNYFQITFLKVQLNTLTGSKGLSTFMTNKLRKIFDKMLIKMVLVAKG